MAWTVIPDSDIDPDSPVTTGLMTALRDNVASAMNGDTGAPKMQTAGIADGAIIEAKHTAITAGASYRYGVDETEQTSVSASYEKLHGDIVIPRSGTYRVTFDIKYSGTGAGFGRIYKNASTAYSGDVAVGTEQTSTTSYVTKTEDLVFNAGDIVSIYAKRTTSATCYIRNFRIAAAVKQHG